jgi:hypothetical protein
MNTNLITSTFQRGQFISCQRIILGFLASLCITFTASVAGAAIIASETFPYTTGADLAGNNLGTGWGGPWSAPENPITKATVIDTSANPLTYSPAGGTTIDGGNQALQVSRDGTASNRAGARQLAAPLQKTFYAGYLYRYDGQEFGGSNNTFTMHLSNSDSNNNSLNFGIRGNTPGSATAPPAGGPQEFIVRSGTGTPPTGAFGGGDVVNGKEYLLLAKLTYSGTNYDQIDVWVDPDVNPGAPDLSLSLTAGTGLTQISHIFFRRAADEAEDIHVADGIILADEFSDILVVPEPASCVFLIGLALGFFGITSRRRLQICLK